MPSLHFVFGLLVLASAEVTYLHQPDIPVPTTLSTQLDEADQALHVEGHVFSFIADGSCATPSEEFPGGGIFTVSETPEECGQLCLANENCKAISWCSGHCRGTCHLHMVSGIDHGNSVEEVKCWALETNPIIIVDGKPFNKIADGGCATADAEFPTGGHFTHVADVSSCAMICKSDRDCRAFAFAGDGTCHLHYAKGINHGNDLAGVECWEKGYHHQCHGNKYKKARKGCLFKFFVFACILMCVGVCICSLRSKRSSVQAVVMEKEIYSVTV